MYRNLFSFSVEWWCLSTFSTFAHAELTCYPRDCIDVNQQPYRQYNTDDCCCCCYQCRINKEQHVYETLYKDHTLPDPSRTKILLNCLTMESLGLVDGWDETFEFCSAKFVLTFLFCFSLLLVWTAQHMHYSSGNLLPSYFRRLLTWRHPTLNVTIAITQLTRLFKNHLKANLSRQGNKSEKQFRQVWCSLTSPCRRNAVHSIADINILYTLVYSKL